MGQQIRSTVDHPIEFGRLVAGCAVSAGGGAFTGWMSAHVFGVTYVSVYEGVCGENVCPVCAGGRTK